MDLYVLERYEAINVKLKSQNLGLGLDPAVISELKDLNNNWS